MIQIVLLGQPYWAKKLVAWLNTSAGRVSTSFVSSREIFTGDGLRQIAAADLLVRVGYRPAASTLRGYGFDVVWHLLRRLNPRCRVLYYWIGTDVQNAVADHRMNRLIRHRWHAAAKDWHVVAAPWLVGELQELGLEPRTVVFPTKLPDGPAGSALPKPFQVLTYIPDARYQFYGAECIYDCAKLLPSTLFSVIGGLGKWVKFPLPNLQFHGWQPEVVPHILKASVVVRLAQHDAVGAIVLEALALARHVIYNYPMPFTHRVEFGDVTGVARLIQTFREEAEADQLSPNWLGLQYVRSHFDFQLSLDSLISTFSQAASR